MLFLPALSSQVSFIRSSISTRILPSNKLEIMTEKMKKNRTAFSPISDLV
jgi:hypothetical protein